MSLCTNPKPDYRPPGVDRHEELNQIPIWEKYTLTIPEASSYFRINEKRLRELVNSDKSAPYILWNGSRPQIKRKLFEQFIDDCDKI